MAGEGNDIPHVREDLDRELDAPVGREADAVAALLRFLNGEG